MNISTRSSIFNMDATTQYIVKAHPDLLAKMDFFFGLFRVLFCSNIWQNALC